MMLHELVGRSMVCSLMSHAASELAAGCTNEDEEDISKAFTKVCAYGMDLGIHPEKEAIKNVVSEVVEKISPENIQKLSDKKGGVNDDEGLE